MFRLLIALFALAGLSPAHAQVGVEISLPSVSIGINLPIYPELVLLPGSPVYYAPRARSNYFFYDGLYWVYNDDNWYSSDWYNGPWQIVGPQYVPLFILRVPVRYYRRPPAYFHGWRADAPPRWGDHWGNDWEGQRRGWNQWNRHDVPRAAPLPVYQKKYSGSRYPGAPERQQAIRSEHYRYQPREAISQEHFKRPAQRAQPEAEARRPAAERPRVTPESRQSAPDRPREATVPRQAAPERQADRPRETRRPEQDARPARAPAPQAEPRQQPEPGRQAPARQQAAPPESRPAPAEQSRQRPQPAPAMQRQPGNAPEGKREPERGGGQSERGRDNNRNDERGPDRRQ
ncbi:MAG: hypothetical protein WAV95_16700 [Azonexus sp.]